MSTLSSPPGSALPIARVLLMALVALALSRLISLGFYPLMDLTESRYADIARRMVERGDWVTPWYTDTQPFWGKPVLSFWATSLGLGVFGNNEFGARVPHYLMGVLTALVLWWSVAQHASVQTSGVPARRLAWYAVVLMSGSLLFCLSAGAVMTDMALMLGTTMAMAGFWSCVNGQSPSQGQRLAAHALLFGGLAVGLLAKGPIALVLSGMPIAAWALWDRRIAHSWRAVRWIAGALVLAVLVVPWYALAEIRSPGFLRYFIIGEHWHRFVTPGWGGDLYGSAHKFFRGSIWVFALATVLPWTLLLPVPALLSKGGRVALPLSQRRYLLVWALWPCVFFTVAGNILWTYVLPGVPAAALLAAALFAGGDEEHALRTDRLFASVLLMLSIAIPVAIALGNHSGLFEKRSMKSLVQVWAAQAKPGEPLLEMPQLTYSTSFYSAGKARAVPNAQALQVLPPQPAGQAAYVLMTLDELAKLPTALRARLVRVASSHERALLRLSP